MTNDQNRMTKEIRNPNAETCLPPLGAGDLSSFVLRHSFVIREFDLHHVHAGVRLVHAHGYEQRTSRAARFFWGHRWSGQRGKPCMRTLSPMGRTVTFWSSTVGDNGCPASEGRPSPQKRGAMYQKTSSTSCLPQKKPNSKNGKKTRHISTAACRLR
jgi:hypothetical protein